MYHDVATTDLVCPSRLDKMVSGRVIKWVARPKLA